MKIAVASPPIQQNLNDGLFWLEKLSSEAANAQTEIICLPKSYLPGYPGMPYPPEDSAKRSITTCLQNCIHTQNRHNFTDGLASQRPIF